MYPRCRCNADGGRGLVGLYLSWSDKWRYRPRATPPGPYSIPAALATVQLVLDDDTIATSPIRMACCDAPTVGSVSTFSPSCRRYRMVVLPALSSLAPHHHSRTSGREPNPAIKGRTVTHAPLSRPTHAPLPPSPPPCPPSPHASSPYGPLPPTYIPLTDRSLLLAAAPPPTHTHPCRLSPAHHPPLIIMHHHPHPTPLAALPRPAHPPSEAGFAPAIQVLPPTTLPPLSFHAPLSSPSPIVVFRSPPPPLRGPLPSSPEHQDPLLVLAGQRVQHLRKELPHACATSRRAAPALEHGGFVLPLERSGEEEDQQDTRKRDVQRRMMFGNEGQCVCETQYRTKSVAFHPLALENGYEGVLLLALPAPINAPITDNLPIFPRVLPFYQELVHTGDLRHNIDDRPSFLGRVRMGGTGRFEWFIEPLVVGSRARSALSPPPLSFQKRHHGPNHVYIHTIPRPGLGGTVGGAT